MAIYIYKLINDNDKLIPKLIDTWNNGTFKYSHEKLNRGGVLDMYNRGYHFTSEDSIINKFEIPDEILEQAGIDIKKLSPDQLKAMFAKLAEKGLLKDKPGDKKSTGKGSDKPTTKDPEGASGSGRPGLVKKKVTVHRGGKTFEQERWVKAGEDEPVEKPKKGEEPTGEVPGKSPGKSPGESPGELPSKPKGLIIQGLNKPDGETDDKEIKGKEFMDWQHGDEIPGGVKIGSVVDVGKFGTHTVKEIVGGVIIGEDGKPYAITSIEAVESVASEDDKDKSFGKPFTAEDDKKAHGAMSKHMDELRSDPDDFEAEKQIVTTREYTARGYRDINRYLREGRRESHDDEYVWELDQKIDLISGFIKEAPKVKGTVYRGIGWGFDDTGDPKAKFDEFMSNMKVGERTSLKPFTSTSTAKDTVNVFLDMKENPVILQIESKNGVYLNGASSLAYEKEVLFDKDSEFMVKSINTDEDGVTHIVMDEVDTVKDEPGEKSGVKSESTKSTDKEGTSEKSKKPSPKREKFEMAEYRMTNELDAMEAGLPESAHGITLSLCEFEGGNKAIYKYSGDEMDTVGEAGYHDLAETIGWDMVPQTEIVDLGAGEGSCQAFINGKHPKWSDSDDNVIKVTEDHFEDIAQIVAMDTILGNEDRHDENMIIDDNGDVWAIDNDTWTGNAVGYDEKSIEDVFDSLDHYCGTGHPGVEGFNKTFRFLSHSLDTEGFKKFKSVLNTKLAEIVKHEDTAKQYYHMDGGERHTNYISSNIEYVKKYLGENK